MFLESFIKTYKWEDGIDLVIKKVDQDCPSAIIKKEGWKKTMYHKMNLILEGFKHVNNGDIFIFTDIDVIFFNSYKDKILKEIEHKDIMFSIDLKKSKDGSMNIELCSGIIAIKASSKTRKFFEDVVENMANFPSCQPTNGLPSCFICLFRINFSMYLLGLFSTAMPWPTFFTGKPASCSLATNEAAL
jgi:hypothetical protein